jgi:hypothetical protein
MLRFCCEFAGSFLYFLWIYGFASAVVEVWRTDRKAHPIRPFRPKSITCKSKFCEPCLIFTWVKIGNMKSICIYWLLYVNVYWISIFHIYCYLQHMQVHGKLGH